MWFVGVGTDTLMLGGRSWRNGRGLVHITLLPSSSNRLLIRNGRSLISRPRRGGCGNCGLLVGLSGWLVYCPFFFLYCLLRLLRNVSTLSPPCVSTFLLPSLIPDSARLSLYALMPDDLTFFFPNAISFPLILF